MPDAVRRLPRPARALAAGLAVVLSTGCGVPFVGGEDEPSAEQRRARCDGLAAQAIDAEELLDARRLAARAADCYAQEAQRR